MARQARNTLAILIIMVAANSSLCAATSGDQSQASASGISSLERDRNSNDGLGTYGLPLGVGAGCVALAGGGHSSSVDGIIPNSAIGPTASEDIQPNVTDVVIPEAPSALLAGTALTAISGLMRRKQKK